MSRCVKFSQWLLMALAAVSAQGTETYRLDAGNTRVSFAIERLGIQWMTARFSDISGQFVMDQAASSKVDVSVGIASLDCNEPRWSERLRSAEWLDALRYPRMSYHSSRIEISERRGVAHGELTLHGVTHPIVLIVSLLECPAVGHCQFAAHGHIKRSEFGLPHGFWTGGDQVEIAISGTLDGTIKDASARQN
jgi:polyisoprenoid-binding protein YceI